MDEIFDKKTEQKKDYENKMIENEDLSYLEILQAIIENVKLIIIFPLTIGVITLIISFLIPPTYTAKTQFLPPQQQQSAAASVLASLGNLGGLAGAVGAIKNPADQFLTIIRSESLQDQLIEKYKLSERYEKETKFETRLEINQNVRAYSGKDGFITIEVDDKEPIFSAQLANAHVEELTKIIGRLAITEAQNRRIFFEKQLYKIKQNLNQAEETLRLSGISPTILKTNPSSAISSVALLQAAITAQELKIGAMKSYLAESAPEVKAAIHELNNYKNQLNKQDKNSKKINQNEDAVESDYISKYREYKYQETLFELISKQYELAKIDEAREGSIIQVLDVAQVPEKKTKPKKGLIIISATLFSGLIIITYIILRKKIEKNIKLKNEINKIKNLIKKTKQRRM